MISLAVALLKRAQILIADAWGVLKESKNEENKAAGDFTDIE